MTRTSDNSSKRTKSAKKNNPRVDQPFEPSLFKEARSIAERYRIVLDREDDDYLARAVEFPTIFASAPTLAECERKIREMLTVAVATMLEMGDTPPLPASKRRTQVNIRLSGDEKLLLEESAARAGFRGLSDFVRFAALAYAQSGPKRKRAG